MEGSKPLTPAEAHRARILGAGIIAAHPRSGLLRPGRGGAVTLRAAAVEEGEWRLPLFLRVRDGRQLHLVLKVGSGGGGGAEGSRVEAASKALWQCILMSRATMIAPRSH